MLIGHSMELLQVRALRSCWTMVEFRALFFAAPCRVRHELTVMVPGLTQMQTYSAGHVFPCKCCDQFSTFAFLCLKRQEMLQVLGRGNLGLKLLTTLGDDTS